MAHVRCMELLECVNCDKRELIQTSPGAPIEEAQKSYRWWRTHSMADGSQLRCESCGDKWAAEQVGAK